MTVATQGLCPICRVFPAVSPHHIKPRADGGTDDDKNIVSLCVACHDIVEDIYDRTGQEYSPSLAGTIRLIMIPVIGKAEDAFDDKRAYARNYYHTHIEAQRRLQNMWRANNREHVNIVKRRYYRTHKGKYHVKNQVLVVVSEIRRLLQC